MLLKWNSIDNATSTTKGKDSSRIRIMLSMHLFFRLRHYRRCTPHCTNPSRRYSGMPQVDVDNINNIQPSTLAEYDSSAYCVPRYIGYWGQNRLDHGNNPTSKTNRENRNSENGILRHSLQRKLAQLFSL